MEMQDALYRSIVAWCENNPVHCFNCAAPENSTYAPKLFSDIKGIYCNEVFFMELLRERDYSLRYFNQDKTKFCEIPIYVVKSANHPNAVITG